MINIIKLDFLCGASVKDLGKKCFAINEFYDNDYLNRLLEELKFVV